MTGCSMILEEFNIRTSLTDDSEDIALQRMALEDAKTVLTDAEREALDLRSDGLSLESLHNRVFEVKTGKLLLS